MSRGQELTLRLKADGLEFDSVRYLLDTSFIASKGDTAPVVVPTTDLLPGIKVLTAQVYTGAEYNEVTTNIVLLSANAPVRYEYEILNTYPHDEAAFTQGLEYHDGIFYESAGGWGESSLRKVDPGTGKVTKSINMPENVFAEGLTVVDDRLIQLTWQNRVGYVYDKNSFEKLKEFAYQASDQGWGLCNDGTRLYKSDGTNKIYFLNKDTYQEEGYIEVYDNRKAVDSLNELEFIDGRIWANVWETDRIVIINPENGEVEAEADMRDLYPADKRNANADVLNGIAWDTRGKRLFLTGKRWDKLFEVRINKP